MTTIRTDILCIEILDSISRIDARINEVELCLNLSNTLGYETRRSLEDRLLSLRGTRLMLEESLDRAMDKDPNSIFGRQVTLQ